MIFSFFRSESPNLNMSKVGIVNHDVRQRAYVVVLKVNDKMGLMALVRVGSDDVTDDIMVYKRQEAGLWVVFDGRPRSIILIVRLRFRPID